MSPEMILFIFLFLIEMSPLPNIYIYIYGKKCLNKKIRLLIKNIIYLYFHFKYISMLSGANEGSKINWMRTNPWDRDGIAKCNEETCQIEWRIKYKDPSDQSNLLLALQVSIDVWLAASVHCCTLLLICPFTTPRESRPSFPRL
jgi:hypothetical protein